jgi:hypothetical protein
MTFQAIAAAVAATAVTALLIWRLHRLDPGGPPEEKAGPAARAGGAQDQDATE